MNLKKGLPFLFLAVLLVGAILVRQCKANRQLSDNDKQKKVQRDNPDQPTNPQTGDLDIFRNPEADYYFTKHARCRMKCRHITQEEVKEIVQQANVNYTKSELDAEQGPKYALEGVTREDKQRVRIIVAPKQRHLTIVTVIDLEEDWECPSCK